MALLPVYIDFLCLIDQVSKLLHCHKSELIQSCTNLQASVAHDINLFSTEQLKELSRNSKTSVLLKLSPFDLD